MGYGEQEEEQLRKGKEEGGKRGGGKHRGDCRLRSRGPERAAGGLRSQ